MVEPVRVTGMGWTTPLGDSLTGVWRRLLDGETGLGVWPAAHSVRNPLVAVVPEPPLTVPAAARQTALAVRAIEAALAQAGLSGRAEDVLLVLGTSYGAHLDDESTGELDRWAAEVATAVGVRRPPISLTTACSSGSDAVALGARLVAAGETGTAVCVGADVLTPAKRYGHTTLGTMSPTVTRPFDARSDGMLLGEGAGALVLRSGAADQPGTHALVLGSGASNDAAGLTAPDASGRGLVLAVRRALAACRRDAGDVSVINAHGSGTPANDEAEAAGLDELFGALPAPPTVFATKAALGHSLGATGALEAIASVLALRARRVPPVAGLERPRPGLRLPVAAGAPAAIRPGLALSLTLGFGGFNTCLVFGDAR
ncbi:beta-ketoacyl synthase N-terminal-like domain-containing protein [Couchioplanes azureus]|uniref:beta-ketoacyl synthase N-terminal-like domain-containing protein n=1 Tax=Couchioplanes caeruleus TaxID=56438 RepID=UPI00166FBDFA|nr:beta-ketoacyl synthase N-terminal-like domain-containing protein [Couchioplanes caeruleus]GGQ65145.1 beta-ketoacyl synthetase [Couchioplanes caeruleus subsp. azureus]